MKNLLSIIALIGLFVFVACGPSAKEKAAAEQKIQNSIVLVEQQRINDSITQLDAINDSLAQIETKKIKDSIAANEVEPIEE